MVGRQGALDHVDDVAALAPVVGDVAGGVPHEPDAHGPDLDGLPRRDAGLAGVLGRRHASPRDGLERDALDQHGYLHGHSVKLAVVWQVSQRAPTWRTA